MSHDAIAPSPAHDARRHRLDRADGVRGARAEWDGLVRAMPRPSPFLLHGWLAEWWRHYGDGAELTVHVARHDGRLVGALPLVIRRRAGLRVASFMGGRLSVLPDLLLAAGRGHRPRPTRSLRALATERLRRRRPPRPAGRAAGSRRRSAVACRLIERIEAPVLDLARAGTPSTARRPTPRSATCTAAAAASSASWATVTTTVARRLDELEPALEEAFRLHALRWEGRPDGSGFATDRGRRVPSRGVAPARGDRRRRGSSRSALDGRADRVPLLVRARGRACTCTASPSTPSAGALLARARQHARRDRVGRRRGAHAGRVPRRR